MLATDEDERTAWCRLSPEATSARRAREWGRQTLADWGAAEQVETVELILSELVTNALRHGAGPIRVSLAVTTTELWIEVHDAGDGQPQRCQPDHDQTSGRGLEIVDALLRPAGVWGVRTRPTEPGKVVYAAMPLAQSTP